MKKFEILRYLKRFSMLIFLLTMAGAAMIYLYAQGKQQYTASVVLKYTNDGVKDGYAPHGPAGFIRFTRKLAHRAITIFFIGFPPANRNLFPIIYGYFSASML